jgi:hypothetical membrane protein
MPGLGPMVRRSAKLGAVLLIVGVLQFVAGMAVAQLLFPYGSYSLTGNAISDLGNSNLGSGGAVHAWVFNVSIILLGLCGLGGAYFVRSAFPARSAAKLGLGGLALASLFAITDGIFPENFQGGTIHGAVSGLTFFFSGFALVFLALAMIRDTRWSGFRAYTLLSGLVTWAAMALFLEGRYPLVGLGGMERIVIAPILLWGVVAGVHLLRIPTFQDPAVQRWSSEGPSN